MEIELSHYIGSIFSHVLKVVGIERLQRKHPLKQLHLSETMRFNQHFNGCCRTIYDFERLSSYPSGPKGRRFKSCHLDQKTAGNLRISGFFLCILHKSVSLVPFSYNYFATFENVPKGRNVQDIVILQDSTTTSCIFVFSTFWPHAKGFDHNFLTTIESGSHEESFPAAAALCINYLTITVTAPVAISSIIPSLREKYSLSPSP